MADAEPAFRGFSRDFFYLAGVRGDPPFPNEERNYGLLGVGASFPEQEGERRRYISDVQAAYKHFFEEKDDA